MRLARIEDGADIYSHESKARLIAERLVSILEVEPTNLTQYVAVI
ncbi:MAG TPA: hypothetical protein TECP_01045 [Hyphomicrobiaceae bacterium MAG_BT-2024]